MSAQRSCDASAMRASFFEIAQIHLARVDDDEIRFGDRAIEQIVGVRQVPDPPDAHGQVR
jgi:hypothetical protein